MRALVLAILVACQSPVAYPVTPATAVDATFQLQSEQGLATAWVARNEDGRSYLVTAGHACVGASSFLLRHRDGGTTAAFVIKATENDPDLCLLMTLEVVGPALGLDAQDPTYGEGVTYVGAPLGVWGNGMAPMFAGHYAGGNLVTATAAPGSSGSAVFTSRGVTGVVVRVGPLPGITLIEPRTNLVEFLAL